ncbi:hypothetical protein CDD83_7063 [Cordyceps sp. RAO-2017]|nr:hypothetical protein CDD83_7063 [Cordyceps sp. RAO-2017]
MLPAALRLVPVRGFVARACFSVAAAVRGKGALPPRPKPPPESEIEESYLRGSGPGGQKINKTSSAVQLKHIPTGIVVKSQATRSRSQNRTHAREILARRLDDLLHGQQSRSAVVGQVKKKRADSAAKKSRRKYRKLDEDKAAAAAGQHQEPAATDGPRLQPAATDGPRRQPASTDKAADRPHNTAAAAAALGRDRSNHTPRS